MKVITQNRKAYHDYVIEDEIEVGIALFGSEVKSLRCSKADISAAYAHHIRNEIFVSGVYIAEYNQAKIFNHSPTRQRKLLLHKKEIKKFIGLIERKGYTFIPLLLYFNKRNIAKILLGIAKGKKKYDKRESIKQKDSKRDQERLLKNYPLPT